MEYPSDFYDQILFAQNLDEAHLILVDLWKTDEDLYFFFDPFEHPGLLLLGKMHFT